MNFEQYVNILKRKVPTNNENIVFLCIGTTKFLWDSLGPTVGTYLKQNIDGLSVIGDTKKNFCQKRHLLYNYYKLKNKYIIAIDTALTNKSLNQKLFISNTPISMGLALGKNKATLGNLSIKFAISTTQKITQNDITLNAIFIAKGICKLFE